MDHLVLHKHGIIIIESKSVTSEIHINGELEFVRIFGRKRTGMASPIKQAQRQGDLLRKLLVDHKEKLRRKYLMGLKQGGFHYCPLQVLVAISDQGIIKRPRKKGVLPELNKADQIVDRVDDIIKRHKHAAKLTSKIDGDWGIYTFHPEETERIRAFLLEQHVEPKTKSPAQPEMLTKSPVSSKGMGNKTTYLCTHCHSTNLEIRYGRSYYFKCLDCAGNTAIKNPCPGCGKKTKTRKRGTQFNMICEDCNHTELFFVQKVSKTGQ